MLIETNKYLIAILLLFSFSFCKKTDPPLIPIEEPTSNPIDTTKNPVDTTKNPIDTTNNPIDTTTNNACANLNFSYNNEEGCDGQLYPDPDSSLYILPIEKGLSVKMGLCNCSSSYHASGQYDQYAFDFNLDEGVAFYAARAGVVEIVVEDQPSDPGRGGGFGNYLYINHGDNTYAGYYHSPKDGIFVKEGEVVAQGQMLGKTGHSGLAGYPHLHFYVEKEYAPDKYREIPVSFNNVIPPVVVLQTGRVYTACEN